MKGVTLTNQWITTSPAKSLCHFVNIEFHYSTVQSGEIPLKVSGKEMHAFMLRGSLNSIVLF